jgi:hypothetical protein
VLIPLGVSTTTSSSRPGAFAYFWQVPHRRHRHRHRDADRRADAQSSGFYAIHRRRRRRRSSPATRSSRRLLGLVFAVNIFFVFRGLSKGIEKFVSYAMPVMAVCALIVLIRVLTLGTPDPALPTRT